MRDTVVKRQRQQPHTLTFEPGHTLSNQAPKLSSVFSHQPYTIRFDHVHTLSNQAPILSSVLGHQVWFAFGFTPERHRYGHYSDAQLITGGGRTDTYEYWNTPKYG